MNQLVGGIIFAKNVVDQYNNIKQRNINYLTGQGCADSTNYYTKGNEYEEGNRWGKCGYIKDHKRTYLCQNCYKAQQ